LRGFKTVHGGLFSTIQDQGRFGYTHLGITHSGAMDQYAYRIGQKLLNNQNANAIEVIVGLKLEVQVATTIAITGADLNFKINGILYPIWQTHYVKEGDILSFDKRISGQRAYLAVDGGFTIPKAYGSYSTTLKEGFGKRLQKDDILPYHSTKKIDTKRLKTQFIPNYNEPLTLRLLPSYQYHYFAQEEQQKFFSSEYEITLESNRMGAKLKGEPIITEKTDIISEGIALGSVQIPKDGQPILLLNERQTIGGYPKMGTVLAMDCYQFSQLAVGTKVRFEEIDITSASKIYTKFQKSMEST
jgi:biotin-dependent carboxylase-like uncharacterized protein